MKLLNSEDFPIANIRACPSMRRQEEPWILIDGRTSAITHSVISAFEPDRRAPFDSASEMVIGIFSCWITLARSTSLPAV